MDYNGINAKLKAMKGKLVTRAEYEGLIKTGSVGEYTKRISRHQVYAKVINNADSDTLSRHVIEQKLTLTLYDDFMRIYGFIGDTRIRQYLDAFFLTYEFNIIKQCICMLYDKREFTYSLDELKIIFGHFLKIDPSVLLKSRTLPEFIASLKDTPIYAVLSSTKDTESVFEMEMQLDLFYYMNLWKIQKRYLDKKNYKLMTNIKGTEIDLRNIVWIYRLKKYYDIPAEKIVAFLIPITYRLSSDELMTMTQTKSVDELMERVAKTKYAKLFESFDHIEDVLVTHMRKLYKKYTLTNPHSVVPIAGYIYEKENEIRNLVTILESERYGLGASEIMEIIS